MIWDIITWCWIGFVAFGVAVLAWRFSTRNIALNKAYAQRRDILEIIRCWQARPGRKNLARQEYNQVTLEDHAKAIRSKAKVRSLYGPIIQTLMRGDYSTLGDKQWWRCYKEIYLEMVDIHQEACRAAFYKAQIYGQTSDFFLALQLMQLDGYKILKENDQRIGKTVMDDGAAEYAEAMRAQELMQ